MATQFAYEALKHTECFRLLQIHDGQPDAELVCSLLHVNSVDIPSYEALSYVWGTSGFTDKVKIRSALQPSRSERLVADDLEQYIPITRSLYSALRRFRRKDIPRLIWADAICINQNDLSERSQQVGIMKDIYSQATRVLIWMGDGFVGDVYVPVFVHTFTSDFNAAVSADGYTLDDPLNIPDDYNYQNTCNTLAATITPLNNDKMHAMWKALGMFFENPWFTRVWIIQEAVVAKHAHVFCGRFEIGSIDVLSQIMLWFVRRGLVGRLGDVARRLLLMLMALRRKRETNSEPAPLELMVESFRYLQATDPRDRIYALMGVATTSLDISPDYTLPWTDVYIQFAVRVLSEDTCFFMLAQAGCAVEGKTSLLPSWVPNWNDSDIIGVSVHGLAEDANFNAAMSTSRQITYSPDNQIINLDGFMFDVIEVVSKSRLADIQKNHKDLPEIFDEAFVLSQDVKGRDIFEEWDQITESSNDIQQYPDYSDICARFFTSEIPIQDSNNLFPPDQLWKEAYNEFRLRLKLDDLEGMKVFTQHQDHMKYNEIVLQYMNTMFGLNSFKLVGMTSRGHLVWVPAAATVGDVVCIFAGGKVPFLLRNCEDGKFLLVGECYVQGIMHGEAFSGEKLEKTTFTIK